MLFRSCPGLHLEFDEWTKKRIPNPVKQNKRILKQKVRSKKCNQKNEITNNLLYVIRYEESKECKLINAKRSVCATFNIK